MNLRYKLVKSFSEPTQLFSVPTPSFSEPTPLFSEPMQLFPGPHASFFGTQATPSLKPVVLLFYLMFSRLEVQTVTL